MRETSSPCSRCQATTICPTRRSFSVARRVDRDDVAVENQGRHRISLHPKTNRGNRIGTPIPRSRQHRLRRNIGEISPIALRTGSAGVHGKQRNRNQIDLAPANAFSCVPAFTTCTSKILFSAKRRFASGSTRVTSERRSPACFQKNQHRGASARFPSGYKFRPSVRRLPVPSATQPWPTRPPGCRSLPGSACGSDACPRSCVPIREPRFRIFDARPFTAKEFSGLSEAPTVCQEGKLLRPQRNCTLSYPLPSGLKCSTLN